METNKDSNSSELGEEGVPDCGWTKEGVSISSAHSLLHRQRICREARDRSLLLSLFLVRHLVNLHQKIRPSGKTMSLRNVCEVLLVQDACLLSSATQVVLLPIVCFGIHAEIRAQAVDSSPSRLSPPYPPEQCQRSLFSTLLLHNRP